MNNTTIRYSNWRNYFHNNPAEEERYRMYRARITAEQQELVEREAMLQEEILNDVMGCGGQG